MGESQVIEDDNLNTLTFTVASGALQGYVAETQTTTLQDGGSLVLYPVTNGALTITSSIAGLSTSCNGIGYSNQLSFSSGNTFNIVWGTFTSSGGGGKSTPVPHASSPPIIIHPGNNTIPIATTKPTPINWLENPFYDMVIGIAVVVAVVACVATFPHHHRIIHHRL